MRKDATEGVGGNATSRVACAPLPLTARCMVTFATAKRALLQFCFAKRDCHRWQWRMRRRVIYAPQNVFDMPALKHIWWLKLLHAAPSRRLEGFR